MSYNKKKIKFKSITNYVVNSLNSNPDALIIEAVTHITSLYKVSTIKYLYLVIFMFILKYDYYIQHHETDIKFNDIDSDDLDLFHV